MKDITNRLVAGLVVGAVSITGCAADSITMPKDDDLAAEGGKEDRWNASGDPARFGADLEYRLDQLPRNGRTARPAWPSTYWPTYENSINHRWNTTDCNLNGTEAQRVNCLSPAEKYDYAFNGWRPSAEFFRLRPYQPGNTAGQFDAAYYDQLGPLARHISRNMGNWRGHDGVDNDGDGTVDEQGPDDYDGIETWWGLCHAWVPAAMLEDSPQRAVTVNGVQFYSGDMEALLIAAYNQSSADMIGGRCNEGTPDDAVERDPQGRPTNVACRDTNPGSFHVIASNFLGRMQRPFAEDRTWDYQVWNQPAVAFEVTKLEEITVARAQELVGLSGSTYTHNPAAAKLFLVNSTLTYITESHASTTPNEPSAYERRDRYEYILEVSSTGRIEGGEWIGASRTNHPDFLWNPRRITSSSVPYLDISRVRDLVAQSRQTTPPPTPGGTVRAFPGTANVSIPDNNTTGVTSTATVGEALTISTLAVELDIQHTYVGDLRVSLSNGTTERVIWNNQGGSDDNIVQTINVTGFTGSAAGTWTLKVVDNAAQDVGTIRSWRLLVTPTSGGGGTTPPVGGAQTFNGSGAGTSIPDNNTTGISGTATVPAGVNASSLGVAVNITHPYVGDLVVEISNGSRSFTLHNKAGGSTDNIVRTFPVTFTGSASGTWTLRVRDTAAQDLGTLNSWSLIVNP